jgi:hypothetical protein
MYVTLSESAAGLMQPLPASFTPAKKGNKEEVTVPKQEAKAD